MKNKIILSLSILTLILTLVALPLCIASEKKAPKTLRIGSLACITGWFASIDIEGDRETRVMANIINRNGGVTVDGDTYNIDIVTEDGKSNLEGCSTAAEKLIYDDKVKFAVIPPGFLSLGAISVFEENKVLNITSTNTLIPKELGPDTHYAFAGFNSVVGYYFTGVSALKEHFPNAKNLVYVQSDDGSYAFMGSVIKDANKKAGLTMVDHILFPPDMIDFSSVVAQINSIKNADAVLEVGKVAQAGPIIKGLRSLGNDIPFILMMSVGADDVIAVTGPEAATNIVTCGIIPGDSSNPPLVNELAREVKKLYGPSSILLTRANCLYILVQAIKAAQSLDPTVVAAQLESMDTIETLYGKGHMGGYKTYGIANHACSHPAPTLVIMDGAASCGGWVDIGRIP